MKTYGALARGIALMHTVENWTEADWYDDETGILAMKDGRRYREVRDEFSHAALGRHLVVQ